MRWDAGAAEPTAAADTVDGPVLHLELPSTPPAAYLN